VQPAAVCTPFSATYSAFWVGLGGVTRNSRALEQIGSAADCGLDGVAHHYLWFELWPARPFDVSTEVAPGDTIFASVTIKKKKVTLQIRNVTRGLRFIRALRMNAPDRSSAEWIAEAPANCDLRGVCAITSLTNFGTVAFTNASATGHGHVGPISDAAWHTTRTELQPTAPTRGFVVPATNSGVAVPTDLTPDGTSFAVTWQPPPGPAPQP
jgi:hypothetical protein